MPGVPAHRTHGYMRHGTTTLFAALDVVASGFIIGKCYGRHRTVEFLKFLKEINAQIPEGLDDRVVMDNYATRKTPKIKAWLARRPLTPTCASWINQVERWFAELTRKQAARGRHPHLHRPAQQKPEALQMDQVRGPDFGFRQTLLPQSPANIMWRTLDSRD